MNASNNTAVQLQDLHVPFNQSYCLELIESYMEAYPVRRGNKSPISSVQTAICIDDEYTKDALLSQLSGLRKIRNCLSTMIDNVHGVDSQEYIQRGRHLDCIIMQVESYLDGYTEYEVPTVVSNYSPLALEDVILHGDLTDEELEAILFKG